MRVLHIADVHAGILTHSRTDPRSGLPTALEATLRCFDAAIDIAIEQSVDAVIVAGDIYHSPNPSAAAIVGIEEQLERLRVESVPTLVYPGNHERAANERQRTILAVHGSGLLRAEQTTVAESDCIVELGDLLVGVLPSFSRQRFGDVGREEAERLTVDYLERTLGGWAEGDPAKPNIVTGHWPVSGSLLGGEVDISIITEPMLSPADLEGPWRYAAMGHIHRAQTIKSAEAVVGMYAGAIDRFNFGEEDYTPVALVVDLDAGGGLIHVEEVELPARIFRTIGLSGAGELTPNDLIAADSAGIFRIRGKFPEGPVHRDATGNARAMANALYDAGAAVVRVEIESIRADRVRVADITEAPTELEALDRWIEEANDIEPEVAVGLREFAKGLVEQAGR